jgi:O-antigen/teichoic acid export membrane protein
VGPLDNSATGSPDIVPPMNNRRKIAANFLGMTLTGFLSMLVGIIIGIYVRRKLGPIAMGQVNWNIAVLSYLGLIANPGLQLIGQRDVARRPSNAEQTTSLILSLQTLFSFVAYGLVLTIAMLNVRGKTISYLLIIQGLSFLLTAWDAGFVVRAHERMIAPAMAGVILTALQIPFLIAVIHRPEDVFLYVELGLPFVLLGVIFNLWFTQRHRLLKLNALHATFIGARKLLAESWPLALSQGAILVYYNCDSIILGFASGDYAVGQYTTAYRLMLTATVLSTALWNAYLPALARMHDRPYEGSHISTTFSSLLAWMGFPIATLGWLFGQHVVSLMYGAQFQDSGPYFEWLCLNVALVFINIGIGSPLMVWGRQKLHFMITGLGALVNLGLNLLVIPVYGAWGAVATTLIAEFVVLILLIYTRNQRAISLPPMFTTFLPPLICCAAVAIVIEVLPKTFGAYWWVECPIGLAVLGLCFYFIERKIATRMLESARNTMLRISNSSR